MRSFLHGVLAGALSSGADPRAERAHGGEHADGRIPLFHRYRRRHGRRLFGDRRSERVQTRVCGISDNALEIGPANYIDKPVQFLD